MFESIPTGKAESMSPTLPLPHKKDCLIPSSSVISVVPTTQRVTDVPNQMLGRCNGVGTTRIPNAETRLNAWRGNALVVTGLYIYIVQHNILCVY